MLFQLFGFSIMLSICIRTIQDLYLESKFCFYVFETECCINISRADSRFITCSAPNRYLKYWYDGLSFIWHLGTIINEIYIKIDGFSCMKMNLKISSAKGQPFCRGYFQIYFLAWKSALISLSALSTNGTTITWLLCVILLKRELLYRCCD